MTAKLTILVGALVVGKEDKAHDMLQELSQMACDIARGDSPKPPDCSWVGFSTETLPEQYGYGTADEFRQYLAVKQATEVQFKTATGQWERFVANGQAVVAIVHTTVYGARDGLN